MSKSENGTVPAARLCHVVKQENFDGYGFNLHAEKGKPGQYIGKVDDGSPAEAAGLKQGDRILEVNGSSILNETHKQVVQRIKAIANEVQLLVIDPTAPPPSATKDTKDTNDHKSIESSTKTMEMEKINNGSPSDSPIVEQKPQSSSSPISNHESDTLAKSIESPIEIKIDSVPDLINNESSLESVSTTDNHDSHSIPDSPTPSGTKNSSNSATITTTDSPSTTIPTLPASTTTTTTTTKTEGLNLNMTAAELRAKLAARKKFDPKNDSVDLRKKFEIIQKL